MTDQQENGDTGSVSSSESCEQAEPTPGPWDYSPQDGPPGHCINAQVWNEDGDCVAVIESLPSVEEANANARLIAAAPDLLDASRKARDHIKWLRAREGADSPETQKRIKDLEESIAKAQGEA